MAWTLGARAAVNLGKAGAAQVEALSAETRRSGQRMVVCVLVVGVEGELGW